MNSLVLISSILVSLISVDARILHSSPKLYNGEVFVHLMPWFDNKETSGTGRWGIHWTMANRNPDVIDESGKRQIAAHYYPDIGPYASRDEDVIEYQLNLMRYAGITGVFIDWPGTMNIKDYPGNLANSNAIIAVVQRLGMKFAIVYEDNNIQMAYDEGIITDKIGPAQADMIYMNQNYFSLSSYYYVDGNPFLLIFGPQAFKTEEEWTEIFSVLPLPRVPTFSILGGHFAGRHAHEEYAWVWETFMESLRGFYNSNPSLRKTGGAYPGFNSFYTEGGWGDGLEWVIPVGESTFRQTLDLAIDQNVSIIQLVTWNDYGEGTIIEPTLEFGNLFLTIVQEKLGVPFGERELNLVKELYFKRKQFGMDETKKVSLERAANALNNLNPDEAEVILKSIA